MSDDDSNSEEDRYTTQKNARKENAGRRERKEKIYGRLDMMAGDYTEICVELKIMMDDARNELGTEFLNKVSVSDIAKFLRVYHSNFHSVVR